MNFFRIVLVIGVYCITLFTKAEAHTDEDRLYFTENELVESDDGDLFLEVNNTLFGIDELYEDDGLYFVPVRDLGEFPQEWMIQCPCSNCRKYVTSTYLSNNRNYCKHCKQNVYRCR